MLSETLPIDLDTLAEKPAFKKEDIDSFATHEVSARSDVQYVHIAYIQHTHGPLSNGAMLVAVQIDGIYTIMGYFATDEEDDVYTGAVLSRVMKRIEFFYEFNRCAFVIHCDTEDYHRAGDILEHLYEEDVMLHHRTHLVSTGVSKANPPIRGLVTHLCHDLEERRVGLWEWAFKIVGAWKRMKGDRFVAQMQKCTFGTRFPDGDTDMLELYRIYRFGSVVFYHDDAHAKFRQAVETGAHMKKRLQDYIPERSTMFGISVVVLMFMAFSAIILGLLRSE